jgi:hypothetical protein
VRDEECYYPRAEVTSLERKGSSIMRNGILATVAVLFSASIAPAQEWAEKLFVKDNAAHLSHDFGKVAHGTQLHHAFPVTNIYAVPIKITSVTVHQGQRSV